MKRRIAAVIAAAVTLVALAATPAHAAWGGCPNLNMLCTYWDSNGNGSVYYYTGPRNTCIEVGEPWDNDISSIWNRFDTRIYLYPYHGCSGIANVTDRWTQKTLPSWWNDVTSSIWIGNR